MLFTFELFTDCALLFRDTIVKSDTFSGLIGLEICLDYIGQPNLVKLRNLVDLTSMYLLRYFVYATICLSNV